MSLELQTGLPSTRLLHNLLKDNATVEAKLVTGDTVVGTLIWQDPDCICINSNDQTVLIWRTAMVFMKAI